MRWNWSTFWDETEAREKINNESKLIEHSNKKVFFLVQVYVPVTQWPLCMFCRSNYKLITCNLITKPDAGKSILGNEKGVTQMSENRSGVS